MPDRRTRLIALLPSYNRPSWMADTAALVAPHVDHTLTLLQPEGAALGSGRARRVLTDRFCAEYAPEDVALSLDDDVTAVLGDVRGVADLFDADPTLGIVQVLNAKGECSDQQRPGVPLYHVFYLSGRMLHEGMTYEDDEYADEVTLSLRAYLAGWRTVRTRRARILHKVTARGKRDRSGGGRETAFQDGQVRVASTFVERFVDTGLVTCAVGERDGVRLPTPYNSIRVTKEGHAMHAAARVRRGWAP